MNLRSLATASVLTLIGCGDDGTGGTDPGAVVQVTSAPDAGCATNTDTWVSFGEGFFQGACSGCHGAFTQGEVQASAASYSAVISGGAMPRGRTLSGAVRARVVAYLTCGAP